MHQITYQLKHYLFNKGNPTQNELIVLQPETSSVKGTVFFIHGHQINDRMGGWEMLRFASPFVQEGYRVLIPSMLGFGGTSGNKDMHGPHTVGRLYETLMQWINENGTSREAMAVVGASRGASAAALMSMKYPDLFRCSVTLAGAYDLKEQYNQPGISPLKKNNIESESGIKDEDFDVRSAIKHTDDIKIPILIVHGQKDDNIDFQQAVKFSDALQKAKKDSQLVILPEKGHGLLSDGVFKDHVVPFLKEKLFS